MADNLGLEYLMKKKKKHKHGMRDSSMKKEREEEPTVIDLDNINETDSEKSHVQSVYSVHSDSPKPFPKSPHLNFGHGEEDDEEEVEEIEEEIEEDEESDIESLGLDSAIEEQEKRNTTFNLTEEEILVMKKEILYQFERLEKKGVKLPKKFTIHSNLDEMKMEYERIKRDREVDASIKFQRRMLMAATSGIEWLNGKFDPIGAKLDGWSDSIYENIEDYDDTFEELYDKYKGKANIPPEIRLLMMLSGSAFMHHMSNSMFKSQLPGLDEILKQNPGLAQNLAHATANHMSHQQESANNLFGNLGGMFANIFPAGPQGMPPMQPGTPQQMSQPPSPQPGTPQHPLQQPLRQPPPPVSPRTTPPIVTPPVYTPEPPSTPTQQAPPQPPPQQATMKGPSDVEELLKELEVNDAASHNDEIESILSNMTKSTTDQTKKRGRKKKGSGISIDI